MIILDTNVISEMMKAKPDAEVESWLASQPTEEIFISNVTEPELRFGVQLLPTGRRHTRISAAVDEMLGQEFADRILPFDSSATVAYAAIAAQRHLSGRPISQFDAQIAAIAKSQNAGLATRNVTDFEGCGLRLIDPWAAKTAP
jgi:toxin FitB